jgi:hypothetical protein
MRELSDAQIMGLKRLARISDDGAKANDFKSLFIYLLCFDYTNNSLKYLLIIRGTKE